MQIQDQLITHIVAGSFVCVTAANILHFKESKITVGNPQNRDPAETEL